MIEITAYKCEHCEKKILKSKSGMYKHEASCFANPQMRACRSCEHFMRYSETVYNRHHGGNPGSTDYEEEHTCCNAYEYSKEFKDDFTMKHYCEKYKQAKERNW